MPQPTNVEIAASFRALADFYDDHPHAPAPHLHVYVPNYTGALDVVADLVDGLEHAEFESAPTINNTLMLRRPFGALELRCTLDEDLVSGEREETKTVTERVPFTVDEIRARATATEAVPA